MKIIKKFTAALLSFIMALQIAPVEFAGVFAANGLLASGSLVRDGQSDMPLHNVNQSNSGKILLNWNVAATGQYMVRVPLDNDKILYFLVKKNNNGSAEVSYGISKEGFSAGGLQPNKLNPTSLSIGWPEIYSYSNSGNIPYNTYFQQPLNSSGLRLGDSAIVDMPTFNIPSNSTRAGVFTEYDGTNIDFLYDGGEFYLSIGEIRGDMIYDFSWHQTSDISKSFVDVENEMSASNLALSFYRGFEPDSIEPFAKKRDIEPGHSVFTIGTWASSASEATAREKTASSIAEVLSSLGVAVDSLNDTLVFDSMPVIGAVAQNTGTRAGGFSTVDATTTPGKFLVRVVSNFYAGNTVTINGHNLIASAPGAKDWASNDDIQISGGLRDILNHTPTASPSPDEHPAENINGMTITFTIPKRWNDSDPTKGFEPIDRSVGLSFEVNGIFGNKSIDNICDNQDSNIGRYEVYNDGKNSRLIISGLEPGSHSAIRTTVFSSGSLEISMASSGSRSIYTFLEYTTEFKNGQYYLVFKPYANRSGVYSAHSDINGRDLETSSGNTLVSSVRATGYEDMVYLPVDLPSDVSRGFQIYFYDGVLTTESVSSIEPSTKSQIILTQGDKQSSNIANPENLTLDYSLTSLPKSDPNANRQSNLSMQLNWDIGYSNDIIEYLKTEQEMKLYYNIYRRLSPIQATVVEPFDMVEITLTLGSNNTINAAYRGFISGTGTGNTNTFVVASTINDLANTEGSFRPDGGGRTMLRADVTLNMRAGNISEYNDYNSTEDGLYFFYPGLYFINVSHTDALNTDHIYGTSNYVPMTLDLPDATELSTAQNLRAIDPVTTTAGLYGDTKDETSFIAEWNVSAESIKNYLDNNYIDSNNPDNTYYGKETAKLEYDLFISQRQSQIEQLKAGTQATVHEVNYSDVIKGNIDDGFAVYFSDINGFEGFKLSDGRVARDALRNNEIICIKGVPVNIAAYLTNGVAIGDVRQKLDGLDKNQRYYIRVRANITFTAYFTDEKGISTHEDIRKQSDFSNIASILTKADKTTPSPDEAIPGTPIPEWDRDLTTSTSVTIHWEEILSSFFDSNGNNILNEYEIIRIKDTRISEEIEGLLTVRNLSMGNLLNGLGSTVDAIGLKTDIANMKIKQFLGGSFVEPEQEGMYTCAKVGSQISLTDNTLSPNTIYFYYVRTVQNTGGINTYSSWRGISATTYTVESPLNLKVLREGMSYDPETEVWIQFDAPISLLDKLGVDYDLQYSIRLDTGDWQGPVTMNPATLKASASQFIVDSEIMYRFTYKISGLTPGSTYSIRVRMFDRSEQSASMYSNIVHARTDIDQKDYDEEREAQDWLDYLRSELEFLYKDPIWCVQDSSSQFTAVYRPAMFATVLQSTADSSLPLVTSALYSNVPNNVYYFPGSVIDSLNSSGKALTLKNGDLEVIFSKSSIDATYNETVISVKSSISSRQFSDYFIRVSVTFSQTNETIEGDKAASPQVEISVECVAASQVITEWDESILNMYIAKVADETLTNEAQRTLRSMIERNTAHAEMVRYVEGLMAKHRATLMSSALDSLNKTLQAAYDITTLNQPIIIKTKLPAPNATLRGFRKISNQWQPVEVIGFGGGQAVMTNATGIFIFTGFTSELPGIAQIESLGVDSQAITVIIAKYGLDDYLGKGEAFSLGNNVSLMAVTGVVARIAGADKTADPGAYLSQKGYTVSQRNTQAATTQETIYLFMALYEMKSNTKIETIKIRDYSKTSHISGIDDRYLKSVQIAFELGIYENEAMSPRGAMTASDILVLISNFNKKIKL